MNKGFSLVELIVVIAIMAILVGVAVPVYTSYITKAKQASDIQAIDNLEHACKIVAIEYSTTVDFEKGTGNTITATFTNEDAAKQVQAIVGLAYEPVTNAQNGTKTYVFTLTLDTEPDVSGSEVETPDDIA